MLFLSLEHASAIVGNTARLRCRIDGASCGEMHSIKWYKADRRVYVYSAPRSGIHAVNRPEGEMMDRSVNIDKALFFTEVALCC